MSKLTVSRAVVPPEALRDVSSLSVPAPGGSWQSLAVDASFQPLVLCFYGVLSVSKFCSPFKGLSLSLN